MIDHAQAFAVLGTVLAERRGRAYLVNVFLPQFHFLPPKIFCGTACEFGMTCRFHIALGYSNSGLKQFLAVVKISMAGHCLLKENFRAGGS